MLSGIDNSKSVNCDNCGEKAEYSGYHFEGGSGYICWDCLKTHDGDYTLVHPISPPDRNYSSWNDPDVSESQQKIRLNRYIEIVTLYDTPIKHG